MKLTKAQRDRLWLERVFIDADINENATQRLVSVSRPLLRLQNVIDILLVEPDRKPRKLPKRKTKRSK